MVRSMTGCLMCGAVLSDLQQLQRTKFCGEPCRRQYATLPPGQRCRACGRPLSLRQSVAGLCATVECRYKIDEPGRERQRQERAARALRARELRDRQAESLGLAESETYHPAVIPSFGRGITNLPDRRRRAFRDHLNRLISEATESLASASANDAGLPVAPAEPNARALEVQAVLGKACAVCRGCCCRFGLEHAYLTVATIRRYMAQHPGQRPRDVLAAYLSHIGNKTFSKSCVFHQSGGCSLPRSMRSDLCNQWYCNGLIDYLHALSDQGPARALFVSMADDSIVAAAFCDQDKSRLVELSPVLEQAPEPPPGVSGSHQGAETDSNIAS
jgi:hypothetical protein